MQANRFLVRQRIREFRVRRGLTQAELAERVGTTAATVSRLETNTMTVSTDWLERFAAVLGVHPAELIERPNAPAIRLLGRADRTGRILPGAPQELTLEAPAGDPVAIELADAQGPYAAGERLIGERLTGASILNGVGRDCIVAARDGQLMLARVVGAPPRTSLVPLAAGAPILYDMDVEWLAPIVMRVQIVT
jgi:transcriptional regulator with XRE-family HTH domain